jgi:predicted chitinase
MDSLKKNPEKFFNVVYAKTVGNQGGGDGWKYRGRGFNQLTGKKNYEKYGNIIGRNLVGNPDLANDPTVAAEIAVAFFTKGKPGNAFPKFKNKTEAAAHFADINSGGGASRHRADAIAAVDKFDIKDIT